MKKTILILTMVVFAASFLCADVYVKSMKQTAAFEIMGKKNPEKVEIEERWMAKNKFAVFNKDVNFIADFEKDDLFIVIPKLKQYFRFPVNVDKAKLQELLPAKVFDIISSIKVSGVKVTLDTGTKKVGNWDCRGNDFEMVIMVPAVNLMPKFTIKTWVTKDLSFDYGSYTKGLSEFFKNLILGIVTVDDASVKEFEKLDKVKGFEVANEVTVSLFGSEIKADTQCLEVAEKPAPKGIYSVPEGFTEMKIDLGKKEECCDAEKKKNK